MGRALELGDTQVDEDTLDLCRQYRVRDLSFFGSAARKEMRLDSDIDMLVEFLPDADIDLVDYAGLMLDLSQLIGRKVDLVSRNGLKPLIRSVGARRGAAVVCGMRACISRILSRLRIASLSQSRESPRK